RRARRRGAGTGFGSGALEAQGAPRLVRRNDRAHVADRVLALAVAARGTVWLEVDPEGRVDQRPIVAITGLDRAGSRARVEGAAVVQTVERAGTKRER